MSRSLRVVAVPVDLALVYTAARGWHYEPAPPAWWLDKLDGAHDVFDVDNERLDQPAA